MSDSYDSTYDSSYTASYDVSTTAYTYDTSYAPVVDPSGYDASSDTYTTEVSSYSYDSTDWSAVAEVSGGYMDVYESYSTAGNDLYQASVDAYLAGDDMAAYELNQAYLAADSVSDAAWNDASEVWTSMDQTTTVTSYEVTDASWSAAPVDTSWSAAPVETSWSAAADTSWSDTTDTSTDGW